MSEPLVKYGLPASESDRIVERHFLLAREKKLSEELAFARLLHAAPKLSAMLAQLRQRGPSVTVPAPVVIPEPEPIAPVPVSVAVAHRPGAPDGLRQRLGLK